MSTQQKALSKRVIDLCGQRFARLVVIARGPDKLEGALYIRARRSWICQCDCSKKIVVVEYSLKKGGTKSCGCLAIENARLLNKTYSYTHGKSNSRVYTIWHDMHRRCSDKRVIGFKLYGAKGISVCKKWFSFERFYRDMGDPRPDQSIDRIDNKKGYSKENCRWADKFEQANNRSNNTYHIINGEKLTSVQVSRKFGINYGTLRSRLNKYGWSIGQVIEKYAKCQ